MTINPIGVAVPFFFLFMGVEFFVSWRKKRQVYRLNDTLVNLGCGVGDQSLGLVTKILTVSIFAAVYEHVRLFTWSGSSIWLWTLGFIGVDLCFYWYHRFSHRANVGWAAHVVHHQSEEYNLAVALRQPWFSQLFSWVFYLPLAILGVPTEVYLISISFNLLYQFFLHTRLVQRLGVFEWFMNTPSHHRVHHGINEKYLDKNYAGVFIIWDRLFGTFQVEEEEPDYGVLKPLASWNPWVVNTAPVISLFKRSLGMSRWKHKLWVWVSPPAWIPGEGEVLPTFPPEGRGYDRDDPKVHGYLTLQLFPLVAYMTWVLLFASQFRLPIQLALIAFLIASMVSWSALIERRRWSVSFEGARLGLILVAGGIILYEDTQRLEMILIGLSMLFNLGSLIWLTLITRGRVLHPQ